MSIPFVTTRLTRLLVAALLVCCAGACRNAFGQEAPATTKSILYQVRAANERLEMVVHSSRILTLELKIPKAQVNNPDLLDLTPIAANQLQIHAKKPGITQVNLWDENGDIHAIDVVIDGDPRELERALQSIFPTSSVKIIPTATSVVLSGYVDRADQVSKITQIAEEYYPKVINNLTVGGAQQVLLYVKVMEISRTKLRQLGFDWAQFSSSDFVSSTISGLITKGSTTAALSRTASAFTSSGKETFQFGVLDNNSSFFGFLQALEGNQLVKVLAEPTVVALSGRPAYFLEGGKVPYPVVSGLGSVNVAFQDYGTQVDFVPIVIGNGYVHLDVRPSVSEVDNSVAVTLNGTTVPGFSSRTVDTAVELKFGQTLALAGLIQQRIETTKNQIPVLGELPILGAAFRSINESVNEIELLILVRPELAEGMDCDQVPPYGPGENTESPNAYNFYINGFIETPIKPKDGDLPGGSIGMGSAIAPEGAGPGVSPFTGGGSITGPPPVVVDRNSEPYAPPRVIIRSVPVPAEAVPAGPPTLAPPNNLPAPPSARITPPSVPRTAAVPARTNSAAKSNSPGASPPSYNPSQPNSKQPTPKKPVGDMPGFLGPSGYDVGK